MSAFENRLRKNVRHLRKWAAREGLTAYRLYDRDIPEYPYAIDWYAGRVHLSEYPRSRAQRGAEAETTRAEVLQAVQAVLEVKPEALFTKTHQAHAWGKSQYGRAGEGHAPFEVEENGLRFWVNLGDYLDTGLFLDHRNTRARVRREANGTRFLNLFAYTGSFSVYAAAGGARSTTSVDLSNTYCAWAERNLALNGFTGRAHRVVRADVLRWVEEATDRYDLVVLDPPSFSASKNMSRSFDVQRDHSKLLRHVRALLAPGGTLYFSTNYLRFELDPRALEGADWEELTPRSVPEDFHQRNVHRCWRIHQPKSST